MENARPTVTVCLQARATILRLLGVALEQADETAENLKGKGITSIICSPLDRAETTARRIGSKIGYLGEVTIEPLLIERDFGAVTGLPLDEAFEALDAGLVEDAEPLEDLAERMQRLLEVFRSLPDGTILAVGHGGAERMLRTVYEGRLWRFPTDKFTS